MSDWRGVKDRKGRYSYFLEDQISAVIAEDDGTYIVLKSGNEIDAYEKTPE